MRSQTKSQACHLGHSSFVQLLSLPYRPPILVLISQHSFEAMSLIASRCSRIPEAVCCIPPMYSRNQADEDMLLSDNEKYDREHCTASDYSKRNSNVSSCVAVVSWVYHHVDFKAFDCKLVDCRCWFLLI